MSANTKIFLKPANAENLTTVVNLELVHSVFPTEIKSSGAAATGTATTKYAIRFQMAVPGGGIGQGSYVDWVYPYQVTRDAELATFFGVYCSLIDMASSSSTVTQ